MLYMINFNEILSRIKSITGLKLNKEIADLFGLSDADLCLRKKRGTLLPIIVQWAINQNINLDYLITGKGKVNESESAIDLNDIVFADVVKRFKQKELAKKCNIMMLELENLDPSELKEIMDYIEFRISMKVKQLPPIIA